MGDRPRHDNEVYNSLTNEFSADDIVIYNNYFNGAYSTNEGGGVALWQTWASAKSEIHNWTVRNNVFYDVHATAVVVLDKGATVVFSGINVLNNVVDGVATIPWSGTAIELSASATSQFSQFQVKNNLIMNTAAWAVSSTGSGVGALNGVQVTNNLFWNNAAGTVHITNAANLTTQNNTSTAPGIVGTGNRPDPYYRPASASSNLVDKGADVGLPFNGAAPDIGAYEL